MTPTLRDRRRDQLRREIAETALALAEERGWAQVTVSDVADEVGISRRAFFTHFSSKDDAIVHGSTDDLEHLQQALESRPDGASFLDVLRDNADGWIDEMGALAATRRRRRRVEEDHPDIASRIASARAEALRATALPHLAVDLGVEQDHPVAQLTASAFAGVGSALDALFAADPGAAHNHVLLSLDLLDALVARAADVVGGEER